MKIRLISWISGLGVAAHVFSCVSAPESRTYSDELAFLREHVDTVVLRSGVERARIVVSPMLQGRVMTSSTGDVDSPSFGWINREAIAVIRDDLRFSDYGGEDRFWLGPEGGQFGLFFGYGSDFEKENWRCPSALDRGGFRVIERDAGRVEMERRMAVANHNGAKFALHVRRTISALGRKEIESVLGMTIPGAARAVGFVSENAVTNEAPVPMDKESGLLSVAVAGQFPRPSFSAVIAPCENRRPVVTLGYFGGDPALLLGLSERYVSADLQQQAEWKIGIPAESCRDTIAAITHLQSRWVLTIIKFDRPIGAAEYVNSTWRRQEEPYVGDALHIRNGGRPPSAQESDPPHFEIQSSSPALALGVGESHTHRHWTVHLETTSAETLLPFANALLGSEADASPPRIRPTDRIDGPLLPAEK
jgi:hypothetical protein